MKEMNNMKALFMVVNAGFSENVIEIARNAGATGATIMNARGEGTVHKSFLGISVEAEKEMVITLVNEEVADKIMADIKENAGIDTPTRAVCFTVAIEKLTGTRKDLLEEDLKNE